MQQPQLEELVDQVDLEEVHAVTPKFRCVLIRQTLVVLIKQQDHPVRMEINLSALTAQKHYVVMVKSQLDHHQVEEEDYKEVLVQTNLNPHVLINQQHYVQINKHQLVNHQNVEIISLLLVLIKQIQFVQMEKPQQCNQVDRQEQQEDQLDNQLKLLQLQLPR